MDISEYKEQVIKVVTVISGVFLFLTGFTNVFVVVRYTSSLVCFYLMCYLSRLFSVIIILTEVSPYILGNYLLAFFPFLDKPAGRGVFYAILGTLCFGGEMGLLGTLTGVMVVVAGIGYVTFSRFSAKEVPAEQPPREYNLSNIVPP